jgi:hypothetical protein
MTKAMSDATGPIHLTNKARGTRAVPTAVAGADCLYELDSRGHNGSVYKQSAGLRFKASEAFTGIANGSSFQVDITEVGDTTKKQYLELSDSGLAVGDSAGNTEYTLPVARGSYGQILRAGTGGSVSWSPNGSYSQTGAFVTVANTAAKTSIVGTGIGSLVIPEIGAGCTYHLKLAGTIEDESKLEELKITVDFGGVTVYESQFYDLDEVKTEQVWETEIDLVCRTTGVAGTAYANGQFVYSKNGGENDFRGFNTEYDSVINTTISNTFDVSATWNTAKVGNIFICKMLSVIKTF